jgi:hypothetical protein
MASKVFGQDSKIGIELFMRVTFDLILANDRVAINKRVHSIAAHFL